MTVEITQVRPHWVLELSLMLDSECPSLPRFIQGEPHGAANFLFDAGFEKEGFSKFDHPQIKAKGRSMPSKAQELSGSLL